MWTCSRAAWDPEAALQIGTAHHSELAAESLSFFIFPANGTTLGDKCDQHAADVPVLLSKLAFKKTKTAGKEQPEGIQGYVPDCHEFILGQLWPTFGKLEEYLELDLLPFGNARMKVSNGTITFYCQHGPDECLVNEVHTCAVKYVHPQRKLLDFVACTLRQDDPAQAGEPCARKVGTDWAVLDRCSRGPEGIQLPVRNGQANTGAPASHTICAVRGD
ncbi:hypothetical protein MRX96_031798 [Rhipicephalus microplus]